MRRGPVFILGLHRSGTTLLYQLLGSTGLFNTLTARQVAFFDAIARPGADRDGLERTVSRRFASIGQEDRRIDAVAVGPTTPEEYGFLLDRFSDSPILSLRNAHTFAHICEVIERDARVRRPLLLKNPWDFGRANVIRDLVPGARMVFIHRNPFHVLSSMLRVIRSLILEPNPYLSLLSDRYRRLLEGGFPLRAARALCLGAPRLVARHVIRDAAARANRFMDQHRRTEAEGVMHVRFEALCDDVSGVIRAVLQHLRLPDSTNRLSPAVRAARSDVDPLIAAYKDWIVDRFGAYGHTFGYDMARLARSI